MVNQRRSKGIKKLNRYKTYLIFFTINIINSITPKAIRNKIKNMGGEFRFNTCLTNINIKDNKLESIEVNNNEIINFFMHFSYYKLKRAFYPF